MKLDSLDVSLLRLLHEEPRAGMREYARILGVARGTVQSRLARLQREGVIVDFAPHLDMEALGYPVLAFVQLHLAQGNLESVIAALRQVPEVLEVHTTAGEGDVHCRVVSQDNKHLEDIVQQLVGIPGVMRSKSEIVLRERVAYRALPLIARTASGRGPSALSSLRGRSAVPSAAH